MAPIKCRTKHKPEKTKVGEEVLDIVISYIHDVDDRNSVSLVSRKFYEIDGITRKSVTLHTLYSNPSRLSKRFPFIESLTLKGPPSGLNQRYHHHIKITPWIQQLALEFRCLKELHIRRLVVHDEDLETLVRTRGKDLRSLKIKKCKGISTDGLMHISKYCNQLRALCLEYDRYHIEAKNETWLHQLALNSTVLEIFQFKYTDLFDAEGLTLCLTLAEGLTLLAKNCSNSLISLKVGECYLSKLGDAFRYAVRLEHFSGENLDEESDLVGFRLPPNMRSLSIKDLPISQNSIVLPFLNHIRKLKLAFLDLRGCQCLFFKRCPNLEVLYTEDVCGDSGLKVIGKFCTKLRKLTHDGLVTHVGLVALAKGCTKLECLKVRLEDISNEAIEFVGTHLKNIRKFRIHLDKKDGTTYLPLDNGFRAMLMGCNNLERLDISLWHGGLTDLGLEYIGKHGCNLRFLSLTRIGKSDAGLVKLSKGCPKLRKLKLMDCPFSKQAVTSIVFNIPSLRYVWVKGGDYDRIVLTLTRPEFQL
ncbi:leucine-rich repeat, cysteine-containing subtype protein [Tanacetum coccineum]